MATHACDDVCMCDKLYHIHKEIKNNLYPLHYYVYFKEDIDTVKTLLDNGYDVNKQTQLLLLTPLHYAIIKGNLEMIKLLIKYGADVNIVDIDNHMSIMYCNITEIYNINIVNEILPKITNINKLSNFAENVIHIFSDTTINTVEILKVLYKAGAKMDEKNISNKTPLFMANAKGNIEVVNFLLNIGVKYFTQCKDNNTLLYWSYNHKHIIELSKLWISKGLDINHKNNYGYTPLHMLCYIEPTYEQIKTFIDNGANANLTDNYHNTPLHTYLTTIKQIEPKIIELLLNNMNNININNIYGYSPFKYISTKKNLSIEVIQMFINKNLDNNNKYLSSILHDLVKNNENVDVVKFWLNTFPNINIYDKTAYRSTLLHLAASNKNINMLKFILTKNIDVNAKNNNGESAIFNAVSSIDKIKLLVSAGADITIINNNGESILFNAVRFCKNVEVVKTLINDYKIDVNIVSNYNHVILSYYNLCGIDANDLVDCYINAKPTLDTLLLCMYNINDYDIKNKLMCEKYLLEILILDIKILKNKKYAFIYNEYKNIIDEIENEITLSKSIKIGNSKYTLYDLIKLNNPDITIRFINNDILLKHTSLKYLGYKVSTILNNANKRKEHINNTISKLDNINFNEWNMLPNEIKNKIAKHC
ncbi:Ankyrin repeat protein [Eptesipox virus]|uniref:Ankyrin repeat protein n=1 Tax=Eptesipox virus TaxID=1329402 RepID=A0A220T6M7_9POXV|nr:Ankyrin repeat protein [Eptesipox virus]ASK51369.1 Ankyrin repeat protein [Eptesipox virus]WAH71127.1 ankyrin repeat protein [Eptesipox virus]